MPCVRGLKSRLVLLQRRAEWVQRHKCGAVWPSAAASPEPWQHLLLQFRFAGACSSSLPCLPRVPFSARLLLKWALSNSTMVNEPVHQGS